MWGTAVSSCGISVMTNVTYSSTTTKNSTMMTAWTNCSNVCVCSCDLDLSTVSAISCTCPEKPIKIYPSNSDDSCGRFRGRQVALLLTVSNLLDPNYCQFSPRFRCLTRPHNLNLQITCLWTNSSASSGSLYFSTSSSCSPSPCCNSFC